MKFKEYLTEENFEDMKPLLDKVRAACAREIRIMDSAGIILKRYLKQNKPWIQLKKTRKNRFPKDTDPEIHTVIDKWFEKEFGWRARSEWTAFAEMHRISANPYYNMPIMFPIKPEIIIWSIEIDDLYTDFEDVTMEEIDEKDIFYHLNRAYYFMGNFNKAALNRVPNGHEVMIKCKKYYWINMINFDNQQIKDTLNYIGMTKIAETI